MTLSLVKGTVHESLTAFDESFSYLVNDQSRGLNGIIVSTVHENSFVYHWAMNPIPRSVRVTGDEKRKLKVELLAEGQSLGFWIFEYPYVFVENKAILDFLINGNLPLGFGI